MMRCRACNSDMVGANSTYWRTVKLETGESIKLLEDLCRTCRSKVFKYSMAEDFDLIDALGSDADEG